VDYSVREDEQYKVGLVDLGYIRRFRFLHDSLQNRAEKRGPREFEVLILQDLSISSSYAFQADDFSIFRITIQGEAMAGLLINLTSESIQLNFFV